MRDIEPEERDWEDDDDPEPRRTHGIVRRVLRGIVAIVLLACFAWFWWLFIEIRETSYTIQYKSVAHLRLSPSSWCTWGYLLTIWWDLYRRGLAPLLISLGGGAGSQYDPQSSEGAVGRDFFLTHGVPDRRIIAETTSSDTEESVDRLAAIARENHLRTILVVSDATHMFRIRELCRAKGLHVLLSPREAGKSVSQIDIVERYLHEMASYTLWRLHLH